MRSDSLSGCMIAAYLAPTLHLMRKGGGNFFPDPGSTQDRRRSAADAGSKSGLVLRSDLSGLDCNGNNHTEVPSGYA